MNGRLMAGLAVLAAMGAADAPAAALKAYAVRGDSIDAALTETKGDARRGRAIVADRTRGLCLLCHAGPFEDAHMHGDLAPDLRGAGSRWSEGQLRLRLVDMKRLNPETIMPPFYRTEGLTRVGGPWKDVPVLSAQEIEDVIAFLLTLKAP